MIVRRTILAGLLAMLAMPATAQSVKLQNHEITALLSGNTAVGTWDGVNYRQYFDPDGTTIYAAEGLRSTSGEWRVQNDTYESIWQNDAEWEGWFVMEFGGDFYWVSKATPPTLFTLLSGEQMVAN
ncbi:MAG: hypothetical protein ACI91Z_000173 [Yoonia sp.]|jgi:hypothetical protein